MVARSSEPKRPGWYPHRYDVEGMQSYWNGSSWTGESRPKPEFLIRGVAFWAVVLAVGIDAVALFVFGSVWWLGLAIGTVATIPLVLAVLRVDDGIGKRFVRWLLWTHVALWWVLAIRPLIPSLNEEVSSG